jgi:hypothetical protein
MLQSGWRTEKYFLPAHLSPNSCIRERLVNERTGITNQIRAFLLERGVVRQGPWVRRLVSVPGIGPIISSAMVAAIGNW